MADLEPYGDVTYADPGYQQDGEKRYPLDTEAHVRAAASYFGRPANRDRYTKAQQTHVEKQIRAAESKHGVDRGSYQQVIDHHT